MFPRKYLNSITTSSTQKIRNNKDIKGRYRNTKNTTKRNKNKKRKQQQNKNYRKKTKGLG
jgi:hypothetical protein